jgi:hypothetical protein
VDLCRDKVVIAREMTFPSYSAPICSCILEKNIKFFFIFLIFDLIYLIRVQSSEPLHATMNPTSCFLDHGLHVLKLRFFFAKPSPKCERDINFSLDYNLWVKNSDIPQSKQNRVAFWRIFSSNKSVPANKKTGFNANRDPNKQEVGFILAWIGSELWSI